MLCSHSISVKGRLLAVPALALGSGRIIAPRGLVRVAFLHDEEWLPEAERPDPLAAIAAVRTSGLGADIFTFTQRPPDCSVRHPFHCEWDNAAVIPLATYDRWWNALPQIGRRNVRTAEKKGVRLSVVPFDDALVAGITALYNEAPTRLGKPFWHYGKDAATVARENGTYLDRSIFIAAHHGSELIGFIKLVCVDRIGSIMQILAKVAEQERRTTNALIAKAVEVSIARGLGLLQYCNFVYDTNEEDALTDFKRRNGFERLDYPRYFVPLTARGRLALALRAHHGLKGMLPPRLLALALTARARYYGLKSRAKTNSRGRSSTAECLVSNQETECSIPPARSNRPRPAAAQPAPTCPESSE